MGDNYLSVQRWEPNFHPAVSRITSRAVWVRISDLPMEYYDPLVLLEIARRIGRPLKIDHVTLAQSRGRFARFCVEIDTDKPLVAAVQIGDFSVKVQYENLQHICYLCGRLGHDQLHCSQGLAHKQDQQPAELPSSSFGPWMTVENRRPRPSPSSNYSKTSARGTPLSQSVSVDLAQPKPSHFTWAQKPQQTNKQLTTVEKSHSTSNAFEALANIDEESQGGQPLKPNPIQTTDMACDIPKGNSAADSYPLSVSPRIPQKNSVPLSPPTQSKSQISSSPNTETLSAHSHSLPHQNSIPFPTYRHGNAPTNAASPRSAFAPTKKLSSTSQSHSHHSSDPNTASNPVAPTAFRPIVHLDSSPATNGKHEILPNDSSSLISPPKSCLTTKFPSTFNTLSPISSSTLRDNNGNGCPERSGDDHDSPCGDVPNTTTDCVQTTEEVRQGVVRSEYSSYSISTDLSDTPPTGKRRTSERCLRRTRACNDRFVSPYASSSSTHGSVLRLGQHDVLLSPNRQDESPSRDVLPVVWLAGEKSESGVSQSSLSEATSPSSISHHENDNLEC